MISEQRERDQKRGGIVAAIALVLAGVAPTAAQGATWGRSTRRPANRVHVGRKYVQAKPHVRVGLPVWFEVKYDKTFETGVEPTIANHYPSPETRPDLEIRELKDVQQQAGWDVFEQPDGTKLTRIRTEEDFGFLLLTAPNEKNWTVTVVNPKSGRKYGWVGLAEHQDGAKAAVVGSKAVTSRIGYPEERLPMKLFSGEDAFEQASNYANIHLAEIIQAATYEDARDSEPEENWFVD